MKVFGVIVIFLALLVVIMLLTGKYGPARHMRSGDADRHTPTVEDGARQPSP